MAYQLHTDVRRPAGARVGHRGLSCRWVLGPEVPSSTTDLALTTAIIIIIFIMLLMMMMMMMMMMMT